MADFIDVVRRSDGKTLFSLPLVDERYELYTDKRGAAYRPLFPGEIIITPESVLDAVKLRGVDHD